MKTFIAFILAVGLSVAAFAKDSTITACTQDHKKVELVAKFEDSAPAKAVKAVSDAFIAVAKETPYDVLIDTEGYQKFIAAIDQDALEYLNGFYDAPQVVGECK